LLVSFDFCAVCDIRERLLAASLAKQLVFSASDNEAKKDKKISLVGLMLSREQHLQDCVFQ